MPTMRIVTGRDIAALLHPRPVFLVTTCDDRGRANVSAVAWVTPLSHDPPLVGMSVRPASRTAALVRTSGEFVVNIATMSMRREVELCGSTSGWQADKLRACGLRTGPAHRVAPPRLTAAPGWLECEVVECVPAGDHVLFVGRVLEASASVLWPADGDDAGFSSGERGDDHGSTDPVAHSQRSGTAVLLCAAHDRFGCFIDTEVS